MATITTKTNTVSQSIEQHTLGAIYSQADKGSDRYLVVSRPSPVGSGLFNVSLLEVRDIQSKTLYRIVTAKPRGKGRRVILGEMTPVGMIVSKTLTTTSAIDSAIQKANNTWAHQLVSDSQTTKLENNLAKIAEFFGDDSNGEFVD